MLNASSENSEVVLSSSSAQILKSCSCISNVILRVFLFQLLNCNAFLISLLGYLYVVFIMLLWKLFITPFCQLSKIDNSILLTLLLADYISIYCNQQCDLYKPWVVCTRFLIIWGLAHTESKIFLHVHNEKLHKYVP